MPRLGVDSRAGRGCRFGDGSADASYLCRRDRAAVVPVVLTQFEQRYDLDLA